MKLFSPVRWETVNWILQHISIKNERRTWYGEKFREGRKQKEALQAKAGKERRERTEGKDLGIVCLWLDAMGQRLSHAFMNAYFKQSPSRANLYCSPEWGCWLKANYMLQIWPLVKTLLIWHSLDSGLGECLWASSLDSYVFVSTNLRRTRRHRAQQMPWKFLFIAAAECNIYERTDTRFTI